MAYIWSFPIIKLPKQKQHNSVLNLMNLSFPPSWQAAWQALPEVVYTVHFSSSKYSYSRVPNNTIPMTWKRHCHIQFKEDSNPLTIFSCTHIDYVSADKSLYLSHISGTSMRQRLSEFHTIELYSLKLNGFIHQVFGKGFLTCYNSPRHVWERVRR